jgi:putative membrane protein
MDPRRFFTPADEEAIRAAVEAAERSTGGEVVPWVVGACDPHPEASWKAAAAGALLALAGAWSVRHLGGAWGGMLLWALLPALAGATAGFLLGGLPVAKRLLVDDDVLEARVRLAAEAAFLRGEVFATRERTGVLLFVALLEHRVVVLGDRGIAERVAPAEWQAVADGVVAGIRAGRPGAALVQAIEACGRLLALRGVTRSGDDANELPDRLRLGEEGPP